MKTFGETGRMRRMPSWSMSFTIGVTSPRLNPERTDRHGVLARRFGERNFTIRGPALVDKINGVRIEKLEDAIKAIESATTAQHIVEFMPHRTSNASTARRLEGQCANSEDLRCSQRPTFMRSTLCFCLSWLLLTATTSNAAQGGIENQQIDVGRIRRRSRRHS